MTGPTVTDTELQLALAAFRAQARSSVFRATRYRMRYFVWGSGPPIVFIHGMSDRARAFAMVMHHLIENYTCVAYELPDGMTDGSELRRYTHKDYVGDLLELIDHLGLTNVAVLGSSFGSTIALAAMANAPRRFTQGILQGGFAHRPLTRSQRVLSRIARFWPGWFADWPALYRRAMRWIAQPTLSLLPPAVTHFLLENGGRTPLRAAALRSMMIDCIDLRPLLPTIQIPVLMIGGDRDPLVPRWCEKQIERSLPHVQRVEFSGCGHYPYYTHPILMAEAMKGFLEHSRGNELQE
jgi:pimeloyl-ACP methyl ester carboxylesterase